MAPPPLQACLVLSLAVLSSAATPQREWWDVVVDGASRMRLVREGGASAGTLAARGSFVDMVHTDGWGRLEVRGTPGVADRVQARAAGFVEGALTARRMEQSAHNLPYLAAVRGGGVVAEGVRAFVRSSRRWMQEQADAAEASSGMSGAERTFWWQVRLTLDQMNGIWEGYNATGGTRLSLEDVEVMNWSGDIDTLLDALDPEVVAKMKRYGMGDARSYRGGNRCSAAVVVTDDDAFLAQTDWWDLNAMLRVYKNYDLPYSQDGRDANRSVAARRVSFSSFPTSLCSGDDFYVMSSGLVEMETTIGNSNPALFPKMTPRGVPEWIRNVVANRLAATAEEWVAIYSQYNTGTFNNQNMIFDFKRFRPGQPIAPGTFWVAEQIPGRFESRDMSDRLARQRYFGSYNIALFNATRRLSGVDAMAAEYGNEFSYDHAARGRIFARESKAVADVGGMQRLIRYNNFRHDPLSSQLGVCARIGWTNCTPPYAADLAIGLRSDLNDPEGVYAPILEGFGFGVAIDGKVAAHSEYDSRLRATAVSGPPSRSDSNGHLPTFQFSKSRFDRTVPHAGMPDKWDFDWVTMGFESELEDASPR